MLCRFDLVRSFSSLLRSTPRMLVWEWRCAETRLRNFAVIARIGYEDTSAMEWGENRLGIRHWNWDWDWDSDRIWE